MSPAGPGRPHISVVIPAYNEEERLGRSIPLIDRYVKAQALHAEILVVDDGSTDATATTAETLLRDFPGRVLRSRENRGKGNAVRTGVMAAEGRWVLLTDADLSTPIEEHAKLAAAVRDHDLDAAIGSRALPSSRVEVRQHGLRRFLGKSFNPPVRWITGVPFKDTQCGFKLLDRERVLPLYEKMVVDGFAADVELLMLCVRYGLRVREVAVTWRNDPKSSVSMISDPPRIALDVLRMAWRFRRGFYHPDDASSVVRPGR